MLHGQAGLDEPRYSGRSIEVAQVALEGAEGDVATGFQIEGLVEG